MRTVITTGSLIVLITFAASPLPAQEPTAGEVVEAALERHRERAEGITGFTQEARVQGQEDRTFTLEFRRDTVAGLPVFLSDQSLGAALRKAGGGGRPAQSPQAALAQFGDRLAYLGTEKVDGQTARVLEMTDFAGTGLEDMAAATPLMESLTPEALRLYLDAESYLPLRMVWESSAVQRGVERSMRYEVLFRDYRVVDGWHHPFRVEGKTTIGMTEDESRQIEQRLETLRARLEEVPPERREAVRAMIRPLEALADGGFEFAAETVDLRVRRK